MLARHVDAGVDEELERGRLRLAAQRERRDRGEVAARAVAADGDAARVGAERVRAAGDVRERGARVVGRGRERVLGREPVVDRQDAHAGEVREQAARRVVRRDRALDPSAAVVVDEQRARRGLAGRDVEARAEGAGGALDRPVLGGDRQARAGRHRRDRRVEPGPQLVERQVSRPDRVVGGETRDEPGVGLQAGGVRRDPAAEHALGPRRQHEQGAGRERAGRRRSVAAMAAEGWRVGRRVGVRTDLRRAYVRLSGATQRRGFLAPKSPPPPEVQEQVWRSSAGKRRCRAGGSS